MLTESRDGVRLNLHVQPGARRSCVVGLHGDGLKVAVLSPPADGRANDAVCKLMADLFDVPGRAVTVIAGATSRRKVVAIRGLSVHEAQRVITAILEQKPEPSELV
ncbi:MAG: DUF167 domain-containing protein [Gemmatimonas sp.]